MRNYALKALCWALLTIDLLTQAHGNVIDVPVNQPIPDGDLSGLASTINLSGLSTLVGNLEVDLNISGTYNGDLYAYLTHGSSFVVLLNRVGATPGNPLGYGDHGLDVTFAYGGPDIHDYQLQLAGVGSSLLMGTWGPDGRAVSPLNVTDSDPRSTSLSSFQGLDPNGSWTLFVADVNGGDLHQLNSWSLDLNAPVTQVPEVGITAMLLVMGLGLLGFYTRSERWRRRVGRVLEVVFLLWALAVQGWAGQAGSVTGWGATLVYPLSARDARFTKISAGTQHYLALTTDGKVVAWGANSAGQCNVPSNLQGVVGIACGYSLSLALKNDGTVVAWGPTWQDWWKVPSGLNGVVEIAASTAFSAAALKSDGSLVVWGASNPWHPTTLSGVVAITQDLALKADGTVVSWTGGLDAPIGLNHVIAIANSGHALALQADGTIVAWGANGFGQCDVPVGLTGVTAIAAGGSHTVVVKSDGTVVAWGDNSTRQCDVPIGLSGVVSVAAGSDFSVALKNDGTIVTWGGDFDLPANLDDVISVAGAGAVRVDGTVVTWDGTIPPSGLSGVRSLAVGSQDFAIKTNGTVVAWPLGSNLPPGLHDIVAIAVGDAQRANVALTGDGKVATWYPYAYYDAPDLSDWNQIEAISVGGFSGHWAFEKILGLRSDGTVLSWPPDDFASTLTGIAAISAGVFHNLAVRTDGTVLAWGDNYYGQCDVPTGLSGVIDVKAGAFHSLALKANGSVVAWGDNSLGQCDVPTGLTGVVQIAVWNSANVALFAGGNPGGPPGFYVNRAPVAGTYEMGTSRNASQTISLFKLHQACSDPDWDTFLVTSVSPTSQAGGTAWINGNSVAYSPPTDFVGSDSFTYTVSDSRGATAQGTVHVTVSAPGGLSPNTIRLTVNPDGSFTIRFAGIPGAHCVIERSTHLVNWIEMLNSCTENC